MISTFNHDWQRRIRQWLAVLGLGGGAAGIKVAAEPVPLPGALTSAAPQAWNWHAQNTDLVQGDPGFSARYSGPNSLKSRGETKETVSLDLLAGVRLWRGAEAHVDRTVTAGVSLKGEAWDRPEDTLGLAGVRNGISRVHQKFLADGGTGILAGDGALSYGWEKILETYYDFKIWESVHGTFDYQFITDPAFNRDRGPVSVLGARLHWGF